ncbi:P-selectin-like [Mugil cephalus]|uniref:P-selectin-like n=1 Tax=Mugil cephalus TaxID=48193 RepID=UPI001FB584FD|nr:P-selectin-like [Mugil cephalus]
MEWTLIVILGCSLARNSYGWTYHYSNITLNWTEARNYCQTHYTDMVVFQSQEENDHVVKLLPQREKSPYFWIGITKNHKNESWTWVGNNSTWIGNNSWAPNEPNNNHFTEFCVEIYVNKGEKYGKWNDEKCANKKSPLCYKVQCNATSCERGRCEETIENTTCICEPGFKGERCQTARRCPPLNTTSHSSLRCSDPHGEFSFGSRCTTTCEEGFLLNGTADNECTSQGTWRTNIPLCLAVECPPLSQPYDGYLNCSGGSQGYNTTCRVKCNLGFFMIGPTAITCGATGVWSGPRPICANYKQALLAVAGCGSISTICCFCFCWMEHRKRKKLAQGRQPEEATRPPSGVQG